MRADGRAGQSEEGEKTKHPLVSALMPVYNTRADWLEPAIRGMAEQDYPNFKLLIGDNGSTRASTLACLASAEDRWPDRVRVVRMAEDCQKGTAYALDAALKYASAQTAWFAKVDSDDMFARGWISQRMQLAQRLPPQVAIVYDNYLQLACEPRPHIIPIMLQPYDYRALLQNSYIPGPSMYRASVYDRIPRTYVYDGYEGKANKHGEDLAHWLAITDYWDGYWNDVDPATTWCYRFYQGSKYNSDRKGVDYARTMLMERAKERRGL